MTLLALAKECYQEWSEVKTVWVAFSGGVDSHVLLDTFVELRNQSPIQLRAIHVNHHLSKNADSWASHCQKVCEGYQVPLDIHAIQLDLTAKESLEEAARVKRYEILANALSEGDILLTAHHEDDQAETFLIQLLRGAGVKGLSAMPRMKALGKGQHVRPFLSLPRSLIQDYAKNNGLVWIEDESNANTSFTRNFIRHELFPLLEARWPSVAGMIARSAGYCAESQVLLEEMALEDCKLAAGSKENTLSVQRLLQLSEKRQRLVLRSWIRQLGFLVPNSKKLQTIQQTVLTAAWDAMPLVCWKGVELRRYRDDLYLMAPRAIPKIKEVAGFSVRFRQGGETLRIGNRRTKTLKALLQEWGVPPWERGRIPLLYDGDQLVGVDGYFLPHEQPQTQLEHKYLINAPKPKTGSDTSKKSRKKIKLLI